MVNQQNNFNAHLQRQLGFLDRSCASYDAGYHEEGIRIASVIRVLVHQTMNSISLLNHLRVPRMPLLTTVDAIPGSASTLFFIGMGMNCFGYGDSGSDAAYVPNLEHSRFKTLLPANDWWNQVVMILDAQTRLSRKDIVCVAANKDGGAHVDEKLTKEYAQLTADGAIGGFVYRNLDGTHFEPITNAHFVCLRQMGYEILNSPDLVNMIPGGAMPAR